jgi:hypothetical protein
MAARHPKGEGLTGEVAKSSHPPWGVQARGKVAE